MSDNKEKSINTSSYECEVIGECILCTDDDKKTQEYCQGFNLMKQMYKCTPLDPLDDKMKGIDIFKPCAKEVRESKVNFFMFQTFCIIALVISLVVLVYRKRKNRMDQYLRLRNQIDN